MKRAAPPSQAREERVRAAARGPKLEVREKSRRERLAEAQAKIVTTYAETFRRLAE